MFATVVSWLQPRDAASGARTLSVLTMVAAVVMIMFVWVDPRIASVAELLVTVGVGVVLLLAGWRVYHRHEVHSRAWALAPVITIAVIAVLDFVTKDDGISAQIFFFFPVLYGASQLRRAGAVLVTALAVAGETAVVFGLSPVREAIVSAGYVSAALITASALLVQAGERQEVLVEQLHRAAAIDSLTGLVTRRVLDQAAHSALSVPAHTQGTALMLIDLDGFKLINDQYGHPAGDQVLVQLASLITASCRPTDVISRLGGDEIAVLLVGCASDAMAERAAVLLHRIRSHPFVLDAAHTVHLTASIGLAHAPTQADHFHSLYSAADEALYRAKKLGKDQAAIAPANRPLHSII